MNLMPNEMYNLARSRELDRVADYDLFDCIECGCCAYVCPSRLPLVHYYRFAKNEIQAKEKEKEKADIARQRSEARETRLKREEEEREAKRRAKKKKKEQEDPEAAARQAADKRRSTHQGGGEEQSEE